MSNFTMCDGPDCTFSYSPEAEDLRFGNAPWLTLEQAGKPTRHFHSEQCLQKWVNNDGTD